MTHKALLICNSTFPDDTANLKELHGPRTDGLILWRALTHPGYGMFDYTDVSVLMERTSQEILLAAQAFFKSASKGDVLLFYYSGHGRRDDQDLMLCARDTRTPALDVTSVPADRLKKMMSRSYARSIIVILDCCHAGAFKGEDLSHALEGRGRYVLAAVRGTELARDADQPGRASPFTTALSSAIESGTADSNNDGFTDVDDLYRFAETSLRGLAPTPHRSFDGDGDVQVARTHSAPEAAGDSNRLGAIGAALQTPTTKTTSEEKQDVLKHLLRFVGRLQPRRQFDSTQADIRPWPIWLLVATAMSVFGSYEFTRFTSSRYYGSEDDRQLFVYTAMFSVMLGLCIFVLSLVEAYARRAVPQSRLTLFLRTAKLRAKAIEYTGKVRRFLAVGGGIVSLSLSVIGRGYWEAGWVLTMSVLGASGLFGIVELVRRGGAAYLAGTLLVGVAAFLPALTEGHIQYPLTDVSGWFVLLGAIAMGFMYYLSAPGAVLGLAGLPALLAYVHAFYGRDLLVGPCVGLTGLTFSAVALLFGAGKLQPESITNESSAAAGQPTPIEKPG